MSIGENVSFGEQGLEVLRLRVRPLMSDKRYAHTCAVEDMVRRLSAWYCPEQTAELRAAALLHDITKQESLEKQLKLCEKFGIMVSSGDELAPKTFHAKTAAALIVQDFAEYATPTVISAVRWHTTGRAQMTLSEQLLYLADYIDETRTFEDCVRLREMFFSVSLCDMTREQRIEHLENVLLLSFDMTIRQLLCDGAVVSVDTIQARNDLLMRRAGR